MNSNTLLFALALAGGLMSTSRLPAQTAAVNFPAASPACTLKQRVGLTDIEIVYSRPGVKDRTIFGGIVPYGQVWRTGANQATKITFSTPVKLEGTDIPAGTYALFTIPGEKEWTIIINKGATQWGAFQYNEKDDVARFKVTPVTLSGDTIETFTIEFNRIRDESAVLIWSGTKRWFPSTWKWMSPASWCRKSRRPWRRRAKNRTAFISKPPRFITTTIWTRKRRSTGSMPGWRTIPGLPTKCCT